MMVCQIGLEINLVYDLGIKENILFFRSEKLENKK